MSFDHSDYTSTASSENEVTVDDGSNRDDGRDAVHAAECCDGHGHHHGCDHHHDHGEGHHHDHGCDHHHDHAHCHGHHGHDGAHGRHGHAPVRREGDVALAGEKGRGSAVVCPCLGVTESDIHQAVAAGARTLEDVEEATGAGTRCGRCLGEVEACLCRELAALES